MSLKDTDPLLLEAVSLHTEKAGLRQQEDVRLVETSRRGRTDGTAHLPSPVLIAEGPLMASFSSDT